MYINVNDIMDINSKVKIKKKNFNRILLMFNVFNIRVDNFMKRCSCCGCLNIDGTYELITDI